MLQDLEPHQIFEHLGTAMLPWRPDVDLGKMLQSYQMVVMSLVLWYDSKPFYIRIFSISTLTLTYYDAWNQRDTSHKLHMLNA